MSISDNSYILEADRIVFKEEFYLKNNTISMKSIFFSDGLKRSRDAKFDLHRYYKNDWQAIISDQNDVNGRQVFTLDCRNTNDKLDALKSAFKKYFKEWQKEKDLKTEEAKAEKYICKEAIEGWDKTNDELLCKEAIEGWEEDKLVNEALQELHLWELDRLNEKLNAAKKRIAELEAAQE